MGPNQRQGPHQAAQKSIRTMSLSRTVESKSAAVSSRMAMPSSCRTIPWGVSTTVRSRLFHYDGAMPEPMPETIGGNTLLEEPETRLQEPGDAERFSHYVRKEKILESAVTGEPDRGAVRQGVDARARSEQVPRLPGVQEGL